MARQTADERGVEPMANVRVNTVISGCLLAAFLAVVAVAAVYEFIWWMNQFFRHG